MTMHLVGASGAAISLALLVLTACGGSDGGPPPAYTIGGTVTGLNKAGLELQNGATNVAVPAGATTFAFPQPLPSGTQFAVTVLAQPSGEICHVTNGSGSINSHAITSILVSCGIPTLATLAGNFGGPGNADGIGSIARFNLLKLAGLYPHFSGGYASFFTPGAVAADGRGNVYVADAGNNTIRMINAAGAATTLAGAPGKAGSADGAGSSALFDGPTSLAIDRSGNIYVADTGNNTVRKIRPAGMVTTLAGTAGTIGSADGTGPAASFNFTFSYEISTVGAFALGHGGVAADNSGNVYVADCGNSTVRKISPTGVVTTFAGQAGMPGSQDTIPGQPNSALFGCPDGLAVDDAGNIYVADNTVVVFPQLAGANAVRKITPAGVVTTLTTLTGSCVSYCFNANSVVSGVATDTLGNVYVADFANNTINTIAPTGTVTTLAGTAGIAGSADGVGAAARFSAPASVAIGGNANVIVADSGNSTIRKITPAGAVTTFAGAIAVSGSADGVGAAASFSNPVGIATQASGDVYVADTGNSKIRTITPAGVVTTLSGTYGPVPWNVATDSAGNLYVVAAGNNTIQKITPSGVTTTFAGAAAGFNFQISSPLLYGPPTYAGAVATDSAANVYVADTGNNTIRKITPAGVITTLAGTTGVTGNADGTGAAAHFNDPQGIATDSVGNVYVADTGNDTIRKITPTGVVTTVAGTAGTLGSADGTGATASFNNPTNLTIDDTGNFYVADTNNDTIRKVTPEGVVTTVVGTAGISGFTPGPLPGVISQPLGIAISGASLYLTSANGVAVVEYYP
jgi:sugar lactone lactonase YvrE